MIGALVFGLLVACIAQARAGYHLSYHPPLSKAKKGVVMVIHGGGWQGIDSKPDGQLSDADILMAHFIGQFQSWGYRTHNFAFRDGRALEDTYAAVRKLNKQNPKRPLCIFGGSSGGHLALMASIKLRDKVDCVISVGAPIDFVRPEPRERWETMRQHASDVFGAGNLRKVSPIFHTARIKAAVLIVTAACDYYTSVERSRQLTRGVKRGKLLLLDAAPPGEGVNIGDHCPVTRESAARMPVVEKKFLGRYAN